MKKYNNYYCVANIRDDAGNIKEQLNIEVQCANSEIAFNAINDKMLVIYGVEAIKEDTQIWNMATDYVINGGK